MERQLTFDEVVETSYVETLSGKPDEAERLRRAANLNLKRAGFDAGRLGEVYRAIGQLKSDHTVVNVVVKEFVA